MGRLQGPPCLSVVGGHFDPPEGRLLFVVPLLCTVFFLGESKNVPLLPVPVFAVVPSLLGKHVAHKLLRLISRSSTEGIVWLMVWRFAEESY
jgi:hypothetical protein